MERKTKNEEGRFVAHSDRLMQRIEVRIEPVFQSIISGAYHKAADAIEAGAGVNAALSGHLAQVQNGIFDITQITVPIFAKRGVDMVAALKAGNTTFRDLIDRWFNENGLVQAREIAGTTKDVVNGILADGTAKGESISTIAARVRNQGAAMISASRARLITLTEVHSAATFAQQEGAMSTGRELTKKWLPGKDTRTRPAHAAMEDYPRIPMHEKYIVGGMPMKRPGDPAGGVHNTARCRCVEVYRRVGSGRTLDDYLKDE